MYMNDIVELRLWVSSEAHYYVKTLYDEVPLADTDVFEEWKYDERKFKELWYDFVKEISELDDLTFDEIMTYDYHNEAKLEAIADWVGHDAIKDRIYKYNISL